jgi:hypothetical protein
MLGAAAAPAWGETSTEVVPEFNAFVKLSSQARLLLVADVTHTSPAGTDDGELGVHFDYTIKPILRPSLHESNWERERYLWLRVGYRRLQAINGDGPTEDRFLLEGTGRFELPQAAWLVSRLQAQWRDVDGQHSRRYSFQMGAEREYTTAGGTVYVPYAQVEWTYDTRYDAWSRTRYQLGAEIELNKSWRIEPYIAYDRHSQPADRGVNRLGLVFKHYQ